MPDEPTKILRLLNLIGTSAVCKGDDCGARIFWLKTKYGKALCVNQDGEVHWATCPNRDKFKRKK